LKDVHNWKSEKARSAVQVYGLRKPYEFTKQTEASKARDYHHTVQCPMEKCSASVRRLPEHLAKFHHLDVNSALYRTMLVLSKKRRRTQPEPDSESEQATGDELSVSESMQSRDSMDLHSELDVEPDNAPANACPLSDVQSEKSLHNTELPRDFLQFQTWLESADGGRKCPKSAKQHAYQVGVICDAINSSGIVSSLWNKQLLNNFLTTTAVEKQFLPGTIKSYLSSLRHWYVYILSEEGDRLTAEDKQQVQQMSHCVARWITSFRKETASRSLQKMDDDVGKLITPDKVSQFERSELALTAVKCLGELTEESASQLTMSDFVCVRDYLMTEIVLTNACRSGVIANMMFEEFLNARKVSDTYVVSVAKHKTAFMYGPAKLVLSECLFNWLTLFVNIMRNQVLKFAKAKETYLFLSWNGEGLESGQVTRAIQSAWKKAGLGDITCTLMRKSAVSSVYSECPNERDKLADLMCHTTHTASKSYRLVHRQVSSVEACKTLTKLMKPSPSATQERSKSQEGSEFGTENSELTEKSQVTPEQECAVNNAAVDSDNSTDMIGPSVATSGKQKLFNTDEQRIIKHRFSDIINSGPISEDRINRVLQSCDPQEVAALSKKTTAQLINRIKYERRLLHPPKLPRFS
jgi:site-specific recombinase XerD